MGSERARRDEWSNFHVAYKYLTTYLGVLQEFYFIPDKFGVMYDALSSYFKDKPTVFFFLHQLYFISFLHFLPRTVTTTQEKYNSQALDYIFFCLDQAQNFVSVFYYLRLDSFIHQTNFFGGEGVEYSLVA